jgi:hypothetical protein
MSNILAENTRLLDRDGGFIITAQQVARASCLYRLPVLPKYQGGDSKGPVGTVHNDFASQSRKPAKSASFVARFRWVRRLYLVSQDCSLHG